MSDTIEKRGFQVALIVASLLVLFAVGCAPTQGSGKGSSSEGECFIDYKGCYGGDLFWFDSCGQVVELSRTCENGCAENACLGEEEEVGGATGQTSGGGGTTEPPAEEPPSCAGTKKSCVGSDVWLVDGCGQTVDFVTECTHGCAFGSCKADPCAGTAIVCSSGDLWTVDGCGKKIQKKQSCSHGCSGTTCKADPCAGTKVACTSGDL